MKYAAAKFAYHKHWPEAIVVYMQGLNTPVVLTDPDGKRSGWQETFGDQTDRDLKFFDAVLATLKKNYQVDEKRSVCHRALQRRRFTYLLWAARGDVFAAVRRASGGQTRVQATPQAQTRFARGGENDPLVRFEWQQRTIDAIRKLNGCGDGKPWGEHCTLYPSKTGTSVVTYIHPGGHACLKRFRR